jgi:type IV secretory pathway component VirB8
MIKDNNFEKYSLETFENLSKTIKNFSKNINLQDFEKYLTNDFYENRVLFL